MPYKTEKLKIDNPFFDSRTKLLPCQKEMVLFYADKGLSQRKIAKLFNVSRRLIIFIIYPERKEKNYQNRLDRGGSTIYYDREKHNIYMSKHRKYKHNLLKNTLILENKLQ